MAAEPLGSLILWLIVLAIAVVIAVYLLRWLYERSTKETAFVRTGFGGEKVVVSGGAFVISVLHASGYVGAYSIDSLASRSVTLSRANYGRYTDTPTKPKARTDRLFATLQSGILVAERPKAYALEDAGAAHRDLEGRKTTAALSLIP